MNSARTFGQWVKELRAKLDLTQEMLAEQVACAVQTISSIERGARRPSREMAVRMADILQVAQPQREAFLELARRTAAADPEPIASPSTTSPAAGVRRLAPLTGLIGRASEIRELQELIGAGARFITIVGPGGIGKSRLAEQLAQNLAAEFEHGALFVALAAVNEVAVIPSLIAEQLGAPLAGARPPEEQLTTLLARRKLLLILDNFEQLLGADQGDAAVRMIDQLLMYTNVVLLITSRERLRLSNEHIFELDGLSVPAPEQIGRLAADQLAEFDSMMLFLERARQADRLFTLNAGNLAHVAQICALLQGMPLGIELAAAWIRTLSPAEIADEIARSIDFLALANRNVPARHHSMRAVFDHSWQLLSPDERRALARLSVFRGGLDREAARAVADLTLPILASLVDKSLVRSTTEQGDDQRSYRYDIHELLRQYLADRLLETSEVSTTRLRHARYYTQLAEQAAQRLLPGESRAYRSMLERDHSNLLAALHWCMLEHGDADMGLQLAAAMGRFWYLSERWREGAEWLQRALHTSAAGGLLRAQAFIRRAELYTALSEHARAHTDFQEGIALLRQADQPSQLAWALFQAGALCSHTGDDARALVYFDESLELYRSLGEQLQIAMVQIHRGSAAVTMAQYDRATEMLAESLPIFRAAGNEGSLAVALNLLGRAVLGQGDPQRAIQLFNDALSISERRNSREGLAWGRLNLGLAFMVQQSLPEARQAFRASLQDARQVERRSSILAALEGLGFVLAAEGSAERAVRLLAASETLRMQIGQQLTQQELELRAVALERTRTLIPDTEWQAAWRQGAMLTLEQAMSVALR